ncbi:MAG: ribosome biogenesis GTP-binding protein YihA/YsxC [Terrimicrobiaceae bacterium]
MKIQSAVFELSAPDLKSCPDSDLLEVAFIGRSNVGKSSLINLLTGQKDLAKVSATPGKTKLINFFLINGGWHLVDLPGYGYAKVSQRDRREFSKAIADYLERRPNLRWVFVLIDSRLSPQAIDLEFLHWLAGRSVPFSLIFTKTDKLKAKALQENIATFLESLATVCEGTPDVLTSSAKTRDGRAQILGYIQDCLTEEP